MKNLIFTLCLLPVFMYAQTSSCEKIKNSFIKKQVEQASWVPGLRNSSVLLLDSVHFFSGTETQEIPDIIHRFEYDDYNRLSVVYTLGDWNGDGLEDYLKESVTYENSESKDPTQVLRSIQNGEIWDDEYKIEYTYNEQGILVLEKQYEKYEITTWTYKNFYSEVPTSISNPNPETAIQLIYDTTAGLITISTPGIKGGTLNFINISGQTIRNIQLTGETTQLPVNDITKGVYIVQIKTSGEIKSHKIRIK